MTSVVIVAIVIKHELHLSKDKTQKVNQTVIFILFSLELLIFKYFSSLGSSPLKNWAFLMFLSCKKSNFDLCLLVSVQREMFLHTANVPKYD